MELLVRMAVLVQQVLLDILETLGILVQQVQLEQREQQVQVGQMEQWVQQVQQDLQVQQDCLAIQVLLVGQGPPERRVVWVQPEHLVLMVPLEPLEHLV